MVRVTIGEAPGAMRDRPTMCYLRLPEATSEVTEATCENEQSCLLGSEGTWSYL